MDGKNLQSSIFILLFASLIQRFARFYHQSCKNPAEALVAAVFFRSPSLLSSEAQDMMYGLKIRLFSASRGQKMKEASIILIKDCLHLFLFCGVKNFSVRPSSHVKKALLYYCLTAISRRQTWNVHLVFTNFFLHQKRSCFWSPYFFEKGLFRMNQRVSSKNCIRICVLQYVICSNC